MGISKWRIGLYPPIFQRSARRLLIPFAWLFWGMEWRSQDIITCGVVRPCMTLCGRHTLTVAFCGDDPTVAYRGDGGMAQWRRFGLHPRASLLTGSRYYRTMIV